MKQHYALWYRLDQQDRYLIWISDQIDTVYVHQKKIVTFESLDALKAFAATKHIKMMPEEPVLNNFDTVQEWLNETNGAINCIDSMNTWNVAKDITNTFRWKFKGNNPKDQTTELVYSKICQNNTLPEYVQGAEGGMRNLKEKERRLLVDILKESVEMIKKMLL